MKKYIILGCVAVATLFLCGRGLENVQANGIVCAYTGQEGIETSAKIVKVQKDTVFGPVSLPEVTVNVKRKVTHVI